MPDRFDPPDSTSVTHPSAAPQYQLRHRLAGAVIVVSAAALGIPLLLPAPHPEVARNDVTRIVSFEIDHNAVVAESETPVTVPPVSKSGWAVSVGVFTERVNATALRVLLANHGFAPQSTRMKTQSGGAATRVWLGPYADEKTAREVSETLKLLTGEKGQTLERAPR
ncbi:MAG: SPOR domain-containing protein [Gammaproteobacteria bacterium]